MKPILLTLLLSLCFLPTLAKTKGEKAEAPKYQRIYVFGCGFTPGDSAVYLTEVQALDSAVIARKTSFLLHRDAYSRQMEHTFSAATGKRVTCALFFATKRAKAEKQYLKQRRRISKRKELVLKEIPTAGFTFTPVTEGTVH